MITFFTILYFVIGLIASMIYLVLDYQDHRDNYDIADYIDKLDGQDYQMIAIVILFWIVFIVMILFQLAIRAMGTSVLKAVNYIYEKKEKNDEQNNKN